MSDLVRSGGSSRGGGSRTRILLIRQPARSVRPGDAPDPLPVRLAIGVIAGLGAIVFAWVIGTLGTRLGFAPLVHLPGLDVGLADGLIATAWIVMSVPATIIRTGIEHPLLMMVCYALIAVPAGSLAGARAVTPGGPRPHILTTVFAHTVAIGCALQAGAIVWWVASSFRTGLISPMPFDAAAISDWLTSLQVAAGLDLLAFLIAGLWVVLILRVAIPAWLRALCASAAFAALLIVTIAMSMSNATVALAQSPRTTLSAGGNGGTTNLLIGHVADRPAVMARAGEAVTIELLSESAPDHSSITGRQSIIEFCASE